jgi:serine phosphatase RsbU (regulator of sigma subunit)
MQVIAQHGDRSARDLVSDIQQAVNDFTQGEPLFDDMTLVVVRCTGK